METKPHDDATSGRLLVVADWRVDAEAVVATCGRYSELHGGGLGLVVPARLHGLDWVGDPTASIPCAQRQLATIGQLAGAAGFSFRTASVGDPDPVAAICDALVDWPAGELLLCTRTRRVALPHPLDLVHRARRLTGLAVSRVELPGSLTPPANPGRLRLARGHCAVDQPQPA